MKCEICEMEHEKWQAHVFKKVTMDVVEPSGFDRKAYQRVYMRLWRQRQAAELAVLRGRAEWWPRRV